MNDRLINRLEHLQKLHGWCWPEKAKALAQVVLEAQPELVVELGVFGGRAIGALAMACQENGKGRCIGIDPWTKEAALEGVKEDPHIDWWSKIDLNKIERDCRLQMKQVGLDFVELWRATDQEVLGNFEDGTIDVLHSDANHSELVSMRITREWHPKIRSGGILIMDDVTWESQADAVKLIKEELGYEILSEVVCPQGSYLIARKK